VQSDRILLVAMRRSLIEAKPTPKGMGAGGDCYEVAAKKVLFEASPGDVLVHGRPTLQRPPFIEYGHAWVENGENVIDLTNGFRGPRGLYYAIGNINWKDCLIYTPEETRRFIGYYGHWGPWEGPDAVKRRTKAARDFERERGVKTKLTKRSLSSRSPHGEEAEKALERLNRGLQSAVPELIRGDRRKPGRRGRLPS